MASGETGVQIGLWVFPSFPNPYSQLHLAMMIPTSPRLIFKPLVPGDLQLIESLICDPHVREFLMEGEELTSEECAAFIANGLLLKERTGLGLYLIYFERMLVGYCGFMETHPPSKNIDAVYAFSKLHTGKGFATEVCSALVVLFRSSKFEGDLTAVVHPKNVASMRVLEKNHFQSEGFSVGDLNHLLKYKLVD